MGDPVIKKLICDEFVEVFARRVREAAENGTLSLEVLEALTRLDQLYLSYGEAILFDYDQKAMAEVPKPYQEISSNMGAFAISRDLLARAHAGDVDALNQLDDRVRALRDEASTD